MFGYWWHSTTAHAALNISRLLISIYTSSACGAWTETYCLAILCLACFTDKSDSCSSALTGMISAKSSHCRSSKCYELFQILLLLLFFPSLEDRTSCLPPTAHIWRCANMIRTIIPIVPSFLWEMWLTGLDTVSRIWQQRQVLQMTRQVKTKSPPL